MASGKTAAVRPTGKVSAQVVFSPRLARKLDCGTEALRHLLREQRIRSMTVLAWVAESEVCEWEAKCPQIRKLWEPKAASGHRSALAVPKLVTQVLAAPPEPKVGHSGLPVPLYVS